MADPPRMLRRLCTLLLVLACAFAPALPALEPVAKSDDCGCGHSCCPPADCAMPPAPARTTTTLNVVGAVEARAQAARPAARATLVRLLTLFPPVTLSSVRAPLAARKVDAMASVPLYGVHCTFLL